MALAPFEIRLSKLSLASHTKPKGSFSYYVLTKWPILGPLPPTCLPQVCLHGTNIKVIS